MLGGAGYAGGCRLGKRVLEGGGFEEEYAPGVRGEGRADKAGAWIVPGYDERERGVEFAGGQAGGSGADGGGVVHRPERSAVECEDEVWVEAAGIGAAFVLAAEQVAGKECTGAIAAGEDERLGERKDDGLAMFIGLEEPASWQAAGAGEARRFAFAKAHAKEPAAMGWTGVCQAGEGGVSGKDERIGREAAANGFPRCNDIVPDGRFHTGMVRLRALLFGDVPLFFRFPTFPR